MRGMSFDQCNLCNKHFFGRQKVSAKCVMCGQRWHIKCLKELVGEDFSLQDELVNDAQLYICTSCNLGMPLMAINNSNIDDDLITVSTATSTPVQLSLSNVPDIQEFIADMEATLVGIDECEANYQSMVSEHKKLRRKTVLKPTNIFNKPVEVGMSPSYEGLPSTPRSLSEAKIFRHSPSTSSNEFVDSGSFLPDEVMDNISNDKNHALFKLLEALCADISKLMGVFPLIKELQKDMKMLLIENQEIKAQLVEAHIVQGTSGGHTNRTIGISPENLEAVRPTLTASDPASLSVSQGVSQLSKQVSPATSVSVCTAMDKSPAVDSEHYIHEIHIDKDDFTQAIKSKRDMLLQSGSQDNKRNSLAVDSEGYTVVRRKRYNRQNSHETLIQGSEYRASNIPAKSNALPTTNVGAVHQPGSSSSPVAALPVRRPGSVTRRTRIIQYGANEELSLPTVRRKVNNAALFATRFKSSVTAADVQEALHSQLDLGFLQCTKLKTKFESYASFHIEVHVKDYDVISNPALWPRGCLISKFRGRLLEKQKHTSTPSINPVEPSISPAIFSAK